MIIMKPFRQFELQRGLGYAAGLVLFFAPFAYYERALSSLLSHWAVDSYHAGPAASFHAACLRMPLLRVLTGREMELVSVGFISLVLLLGSAFLFGPYFCGRFCFAGALSEYLSRIVPSRFQINWQATVPPVPVRYGFFAGFLIAPFLGGSIVCSYCNFSFAEMITTGIQGGGIGALGSTTIITAVLWLVLFGAFARGGRGFCTYMCPVGAVQNLVHGIGVRFNFTHKLCIASDKCAGCGLCTKKCPTGAIQILNRENQTYEIYTCITCRSCVAACPSKALRFDSGHRGWKTEDKSELVSEGITSTGGGGN